MFLRQSVAGVALSVFTGVLSATPPSSLQKLPILPQGFEPNRGQVDRKFNFVAHGLGYSLLLAPGEAQVHLTNITRSQVSNKSANLRIKFLGASPRTQGQALEPQAGKSSYFIGNNPTEWRKEIPRYGKVEYKNLIPASISYYGTGQQLEYDLLLGPHADPQNVRFKITGADGIHIDDAGNLILRIGNTEIRELKPVIYEATETGRRKIEGRYLLLAGNTVGFALMGYDAAKPIVIDPVLEFSSFFGGTGNDNGWTITLDSSGDSYVAGFTGSANLAGTTIGSPVTAGNQVGFVAKIDSSGHLVFATYLGGNNDQASAFGAIDASGNIYLTGVTHSSSFPVLHPLYGTYRGGISDTYVAELNSAGNALIFSTYFGGNGQDYPTGIGLDSAGSIYIVGTTGSTDLPTQNPIQPHLGGVNDAYAAKFAAGGTALLYSTYLGGNSYDYANGLTMDSSGNAYLYGDTESTNYPVQNALQSTYCGWTPGQSPPVVSHGWVTVLVSNGSLIYSTYICGNAAADSTRGAALDGNGDLIITGQTSSAAFPTLNPLQAHYGGGADDAFVMRLSPSGTLLYSSYLGGSGDDIGRGVAIDTVGNWYITGQTSSTNFPLAKALQPAYGGGASDVFVSKISGGGSTLVFSTYLGGSVDEVGRGIAVDSFAQAYITGNTGSSNYPTAHPFQPTYGGGAGPHDVIWSVIATCDFTFSPQNIVPAAGGSGTISITTTPECGWNAVSNASWISLTSNPPSGVGPGSVSYSVAANTGLTRNGTVTIGGNVISINQTGGRLRRSAEFRRPAECLERPPYR